MENVASESLDVATDVVVVVVAAVVVDVVDRQRLSDSQAPRIGRAALLTAPLRELRTGRRILGDGRTDDGIYYGLHVFQRYPVASLSRLVPLETERAERSHIVDSPSPSTIARC